MVSNRWLFNVVATRFKKLISLLFQTFYKSGVKISRTEKHISGHSYLTGRKWKYAVNN